MDNKLKTTIDGIQFLTTFCSNNIYYFFKAKNIELLQINTRDDLTSNNEAESNTTDHIFDMVQL